MNLSRRRVLGGLIAAPFVVQAANLMKIVPVRNELIIPDGMKAMTSVWAENGGFIADIRIFDRVLSDSEMAQLARVIRLQYGESAGIHAHTKIVPQSCQFLL